MVHEQQSAVVSLLSRYSALITLVSSIQINESAQWHSHWQLSGTGEGGNTVMQPIQYAQIR